MFFKTTPKEAPTSGEPIIFLQSTLVACILNLLSGEERLVLMCSSEKSRRFIPVSYGSISLSALKNIKKFYSQKLCRPLGKMLVNMNCNINLMKKIKQEIDFFVIFKLGPCLAQGKISNCLLNIQWHSFFFEMPRYKKKKGCKQVDGQPFIQRSNHLAMRMGHVQHWSFVADILIFII